MRLGYTNFQRLKIIKILIFLFTYVKANLASNLIHSSEEVTPWNIVYALSLIYI